MRGISERGTVGSNPPASPSVTMQYDTSMPASTHEATVPAAPKSTSSGWAVTTRARSTSSSLSTDRNVLGGQVLLDAFSTTFAPEARLLDATERRRRVGHHPLIDTHHAGLQPLHNPHGAIE